MKLDRVLPVEANRIEEESSHSRPSQLAESSTSKALAKMISLHEIYEATAPAIAAEGKEDYFMISGELASYREALTEVNWQRAIDKEMKYIHMNETWEVVCPPKDCKPIKLKWVYRIKRNEGGNAVKHMVRLVVKAYAQRPGIDYDEVFALVARFETIYLIIGLADQRN